MDEKNDKDLQNFCQKLPKIELHAHLNGSLSQKTLSKLYKMKHAVENAENDEKFDLEKCKSLTEMFEVFSFAYSVTTTPEAIYVAAYNTIKEFDEDNVVYLELRSTPRSENGMTKKDYILAILKAIKACKSENLQINVKLLISVNRKQGFRAAKENIYLAIEMKEDYNDIVGIDLSGDPTKGDAFIELLHMARKAGLKIAAHCAEYIIHLESISKESLRLPVITDNLRLDSLFASNVPNEVETMDIIKFKPDRLGHGTCIHPLSNGTNELYQALLESKIPVELCLTSNIKCKMFLAYNDHHFKYLYESKHPICICTDDKGVFDTSLSVELMIAAESFNLDKCNLVNLMKSTVDYTFSTCAEKRKLIGIIEEFAESQCLECK